MNKYLDAAALRGLTITAISAVESGTSEIEITTSNGRKFVMFHGQSCCESVAVNDVTGDPQALIGKPLLVAREESAQEWPDEIVKPGHIDSFTWTTYWFETEDAKVRIRWLGESNGCYSESVQIDEITP